MSAFACASVDENVPVVGAPAKVTRATMTGTDAEMKTRSEQELAVVSSQTTMIGAEVNVPVNEPPRVMVPVGAGIAGVVGPPLSRLHPARRAPATTALNFGRMSLIIVITVA